MIPAGHNSHKSAFLPICSTGIVVLAILYYCLTSLYLTFAHKNDTARVEDHAAIISDDLWNLNESGMRAYLQLAARTDYYKSLKVLSNRGDLFISLTGPEPTFIDAALQRIGAIPAKQISSPVYYDNQMIGTLQGERYDRYIYPLFYIFLALFVLVLTLTSLFYLMFNRRILEQQVKERTQRYHELVNLLPEMVLETNARGIITFANEKAQNCFDISNFTETEHDCRDYIRLENGERGDRTIYQDNRSKDLEKKEYRVNNKNGTQFPVLVRSAPIYRNNQSIGARIVIVDITERKALEEQLSRDQKMKSIGLMAGGVAHDLNNILSGIINYPELILLQLPETSPLANLVKPIKEAGLRAAAIVADLLTVARGVAASKENANLNSIVTDYTDSPEFHKLRSLNPDVDYSINLSEESRHISCSIIHVRKSLMNLVSNAFEAVEGTGKVIIETTTTTVDNPITTGHGVIVPGNYMIVSVKDSGKGITPQELSHIFEPFFSKKELGRSGTGLGLTVVLNTMQDHDGGIQVCSTKEGSTFALYFPASKKSSQISSIPKNTDMFKGNGESILVVDDEFQQRDIATRLLSSLGYSVESVASGEDAVSYLSNNTVDLVLLDMIMGSGMNGLQTYEELIKIDPKLKAIIQSGFSESDDVKNTILLGAGGLINKPYTKEQISRAVFNELNC